MELNINFLYKLYTLYLMAQNMYHKSSHKMLIYNQCLMVQYIHLYKYYDMKGNFYHAQLGMFLQGIMLHNFHYYYNLGQHMIIHTLFLRNCHYNNIYFLNNIPLMNNNFSKDFNLHKNEQNHLDI